MNIKIFCRCCLFPSWPCYGLISPPVQGTSASSMDSLRLLGNFMTASVLRTKMKEAHCVKTQAINKQVASDNGMAVYRTLCSAEYRFLLFFSHFPH